MTEPTLGRLGGGLAARLTAGARYMLSGFRMPLLEHRSLLVFVAVPALVNLALFAGLVAGLWSFGAGWVDSFVDAAVGTGHAWYIAWLVRLLRAFSWIVVAAGVFVLSFLAIYLVGGVIAAPFNDLLSEKVEAIRLGVPGPPFSMRRLLSDAVFTMGQELRRLLFVAMAYTLLLPLHFVPVLGSLLWGWAGFLLLALDLLDIPMARNRHTFGQRLTTIRRNLAACTGFGAAAALCVWVPLCLPAAVIGGTLLYADLRQAAQGQPPTDPRESA